MEQSLLRAFTQIWPEALVEPSLSEPQQAVDRDCTLLDAMLAEQERGTRIRLWSNRPCVVVPHNQVRNMTLDTARDVAGALGFAVALRRTGGTAVVHRPGVLCISLLDVTDMGQAQPANIYVPLLAGICSALEILGIRGDHGSVTGSYCDGKCNVRVGERKIAGTAALVRRRHGFHGTLVHAALTVWGDLQADVAAVCDVERAIGFPGNYSAEAHTSVCEELMWLS